MIEGLILVIRSMSKRRLDC